MDSQISMQTPSEEAILAQIKSIGASEVFSRAWRARALLNYIARETLSGRTLSEKLIAFEFFKKAVYDTAEQSLARTSVNRLREKLTEYAETSGRADPITVAIPQGAFNITAVPQLGGLPSQESFSNQPPSVQPASGAFLIWPQLEHTLFILAQARPYTTKLRDGELILPSSFAHFFDALNNSKVFIICAYPFGSGDAAFGTFDFKAPTGYIYPVSSWIVSAVGLANQLSPIPIDYEFESSSIGERTQVTDHGTVAISAALRERLELKNSAITIWFDPESACFVFCSDDFYNLHFPS